jgi:hypothetical protein
VAEDPSLVLDPNVGYIWATDNHCGPVRHSGMVLEGAPNAHRGQSRPTAPTAPSAPSAPACRYPARAGAGIGTSSVPPSRRWRAVIPAR